MSAQKLIFYLVAIAIAVASTQMTSSNGWSIQGNNNTNKSHNLVVGYRMPGDRLVLKQNIVKNSSWMKIVIVEKLFNITKWERITMVQAVDQKTNGNGAYASILNGGPGFNNVSMRFKSQRGHGINFIVKLYARS